MTGITDFQFGGNREGKRKLKGGGRGGRGTVYMKGGKIVERGTLVIVFLPNTIGASQPG